VTTTERSQLVHAPLSSPLRATANNWLARAVLVTRRLRADRTVSRWTLVSSGLSPALLTAAWLIADSRQPASYSPRRQTVSVLAGHAGTDRWIVTAALYLIGGCYVATAAGLRAVDLPARMGLLVAGLAAIGIATCPEPAHGSTVQHLLCTGIGALAITIWPALVARRNTQTPLTSVGTSIVVTTVFVALLIWTFIETQHGDALGLAERLSAAAQSCWPFVVAVAARRAMRAETGVAPAAGTR
jgi:hypothetical protein